MEAVQVTDPRYIGVIAKYIMKFVEKVDIPNISYETLYCYFQKSIANGLIQKQNLGDNLSEFWIVDNDKEVVAFSHWHVNDFPYEASVTLDYIYSWGTKREAIRLLIPKLIDFMKRHRAGNLNAVAVNQIVYNHLYKVGREFKFNFQESDSINFTARL